MQRVVKRFLLHNSREDDEAKESDFDEFKQDVQIARIEMLSDLKRSRENMLKYIMVIHMGISILGDLAFNTFPFDDNNNNQSNQIDDNKDDAISTIRGNELAVLSEFESFKKYDQRLKDEMELSLQTTALALRNQAFKSAAFATAVAASNPASQLQQQPTTSSAIAAAITTIAEQNINETTKTTYNQKRNSSTLAVTFTDLNMIIEEN